MLWKKKRKGNDHAFCFLNLVIKLLSLCLLHTELQFKIITLCNCIMDGLSRYIKFNGIIIQEMQTYPMLELQRPSYPAQESNQRICALHKKAKYALASWSVNHSISNSFLMHPQDESSKCCWRNNASEL